VVSVVLVNKVMYQNLWVEKYRPDSLDNIILDVDILDYFQKIEDKDIPNLLFYGPAGTGKTTLTKIIVTKLLKCQYIYINASDENGIDTVRNKVITFAHTKSLDGKRKVVILDEFDGTTPDFQRALRNVMEECSDICRFILTANYLNRIIDPIISRCISFSLTIDYGKALKRVVEILKEENISVTEETKQQLPEFIRKRLPDMRRVINDLQKFSYTGVLKILQVQVGSPISEISTEIVNRLLSNKDSSNIREYVINNEEVFNCDYQKLLKEVLEVLYNTKIKNKSEALYIITEHMYRDNQVVDREINAYACWISLSKAII